MLKIKNLNFVFAFLATVFILSSGVSAVYAAPDSPPTLKLVKTVITDDGGSAVPDDWVLFATLPNGTEFYNQGGSGIFLTMPADTDITLSETVYPAGYLSSDWSCNGGEFNATQSTIKLSLGDRVTCTITSDDVAPTLKLVKVVQNLFNGTATPDDWILSATASGSGAKTNFENTGGSNVTQTVFANTKYQLAESEGNLAYTALNDGKWDCLVTYPRPADFEDNVDVDVVISFIGIKGISLSEGDSAVCTITNVEDPPSLSIDAPSKINGKLTLSAEVKGFEDTVPVNFKVYKNGTDQMIYQGYVSSAPYSFTIPAKNLEAGSSYDVIASTSDDKGKSASKSITINIPSKGNSG